MAALRPYVGVVVNANSRANRKRTPRLTDLEAAIGEYGVVRLTHTTEELRAVLRQWVAYPITHVFAEGGDGTLHGIIRECAVILKERYASEWQAYMPILVPGHAGTINFVASYLGLHKKSVNVLAELKSGFVSDQAMPCQSLPLMDITLSAASGQQSQHYGFVVGVGGIAGNFFKEYYAHAHPQLATAVCMVARALLTAPFSRRALDELLEPTHANVMVNGVVEEAKTFNSMHAATIPIDLKFLRLFTDAGQEGQIHLLIGTASRKDVFRNLGRVMKGDSIDSSTLHAVKAKQLDIAISEGASVLAVIDGEIVSYIVHANIKPGPVLRFYGHIRDEPALS